MNVLIFLTELTFELLPSDYWVFVYENRVWVFLGAQILFTVISKLLFPRLSLVKKCACSAGDPGSITGLGRSAQEGIGYPLQYSWASLVAQLAKTLPAMWETWIRSLGWENPLEKGMATHSSILAWRIP